jgi:hypothetical protein
VVKLLGQAVPVSALVVAVDPGKVSNRVWLTSWIFEPCLTCANAL